MSTSPIDIQISMDASSMLADLERVSFDLLLASIRRAHMAAIARGHTLVRMVVGYRLARRLDRHDLGQVTAIYGVPVVIDREVPEGFGLVTRPPGT